MGKHVELTLRCISDKRVEIQMQGRPIPRFSSMLDDMIYIIEIKHRHFIQGAINEKRETRLSMNSLLKH